MVILVRTLLISSAAMTLRLATAYAEADVVVAGVGAFAPGRARHCG
jgi:hypothetical protein